MLFQSTPEGHVFPYPVGLLVIVAFKHIEVPIPVEITDCQGVGAVVPQLPFIAEIEVGIDPDASWLFVVTGDNIVITIIVDIGNRDGGRTGLAQFQVGIGKVATAVIQIDMIVAAVVIRFDDIDSPRPVPPKRRVVELSA